MGLLTRLSVKIRGRETPFYNFLYVAAKTLLNIPMPVIPGLHNFLYSEWKIRTSLWHNFWRWFYYEPMFKSQCRQVGKHFKLWYAGNGSCRIIGDLRIYLGDGVTFFDNVNPVGLRIFDNPTLRIGNGTYVGPHTTFMVAKEITVGNHTVLGSGQMLMDNPGHPRDADKRRGPGGGLPEKDDVHPVSVGDYCFLGIGCRVYPGTRVGDGVVARAATHIIGEIPPFSIIGGNPGRVSRLLPIPPGISADVGEERVRQWREDRKKFVAANPEVKGAELT